MRAILGKITGITSQETDNGRHRLEVRFTPVCLLPERIRVPDWLKEQTLVIERVVTDPREVGRPGDSIVLTEEESRRWLTPLRVAPAVAYDRLPESLHIQLLWWKNDDPPTVTVHANGRQVTEALVKQGDGFAVEVATNRLFPTPPLPPVEVAISCDKLKTFCTLAPTDTPVVYRAMTLLGEVRRVENAWYRLDIPRGFGGGTIAALWEKGRGNNHFQHKENWIQQPLEKAGHVDRYATGWAPSDKLRDVAVTNLGTRREGSATRLSLEATVDEGLNLHTALTCTVYDDLPLLTWERSFTLRAGKKEEGATPREPIDDLHTLGMAFRAAWLPERDGDSGSRILCAYGDQLVTIRSMQMNDAVRGANWRMESGWALVEHPRRRECMLYLFDRYRPPQLAAWFAPYLMTLEPYWQMTTAKAGDIVSFTLAISAGEQCGASAAGAWIACRAPLPGGGVRCAVIARINSSDNKNAVIRLGDEERHAELECMHLSGVGEIAQAMVDYPQGRMEQALEIAVAGIEGRRML